MQIKRVLLFDSSWGCYGEAFLYDGLCEVLGNENVVVRTPKYLNPAWVYIKARSPDVLAVEDIQSRIDEFDVVITKPELIDDMREWQKLIKFPPIVSVDEIECGRYMGGDIDEFRPVCHFKREFIINRAYPDKCYPLPFSSPYPIVENVEKDLDVFCVMSDTHPIRRLYEWAIGVNGGYQITATLGREMTHEEYRKEITRAKIGISIRGHAYDTCRFLEVIAAGGMLLTDDSPLVKPHPFIDLEHCVYYHMGDFGWLLQHHLHSSEDRERIRENGLAHLKKYHTTQARTEYFLEIVEGHLG